MRIFQVLIVEDQPFFGEMLQRRLKRYFGRQTLILVAGTAESASQLLDNETFDLVLTDVGLPGFDPTSQSERLHVIRLMTGKSGSARHIIMTGSPNVAEAEECRQLGCAAYVSKNGLSPELLDDILKRSAQGEFVAQVTAADDADFGFRLHYSDLTQREEDVLNRVIQRPPGTTQAEIFEQVKDSWGLHSDDTAKKYYKNARGKLAKNGLLPKITK